MIEEYSNVCPYKEMLFMAFIRTIDVNTLKANSARIDPDDTTGFTTMKHKDAVATQNFLNTFLDSMSQEQLTAAILPSKLEVDGNLSGGFASSEGPEFAKEARSTSTAYVMNEFLRAYVAKNYPGANEALDLQPDPADLRRPGQLHELSAKMVKRAQVAMGFIDPEVAGFNQKDMEAIRHAYKIKDSSLIPAIVKQVLDRKFAPSGSLDPAYVDNVTQKFIDHEVADGMFGHKSKTEWANFISDPAKIDFAKNYGPNLKGDEAKAVADATALQLAQAAAKFAQATALNIPTEKNLTEIFGPTAKVEEYDKSFGLAFPAGVDVPKYRDRLVRILKDDGATELNLKDSSRFGISTEGVTIGADILNRPGVLAALRKDKDRIQGLATDPSLKLDLAAAVQQEPPGPSPGAPAAAVNDRLQELSNIFKTRVGRDANGYVIQTPPNVDPVIYRQKFSELLREQRLDISQVGPLVPPGAPNRFTLASASIDAPGATAKLEAVKGDFKTLAKPAPSAVTLIGPPDGSLDVHKDPQIEQKRRHDLQNIFGTGVAFDREATSYADKSHNGYVIQVPRGSNGAIYRQRFIETLGLSKDEANTVSPVRAAGSANAFYDRSQPPNGQKYAFQSDAFTVPYDLIDQKGRIDGALCKAKEFQAIARDTPKLALKGGSFTMNG
jgi:hypothetical protein